MCHVFQGRTRREGSTRLIFATAVNYQSSKKSNVLVLLHRRYLIMQCSMVRMHNIDLVLYHPRLSGLFAGSCPSSFTRVNNNLFGKKKREYLLIFPCY